MYFHRWDFHKAQPNGRTSLQTTLGIANTCISEKWASWFSEASSPTVADSNCRAGRSSWPTWKNGQGAGGSAGFSWLRAPYPPGKPGAPKTSYMFFSSNTGKNCSQKLPKSFGHSNEPPRLKVDLHYKVRSPCKVTLAALALAPGCYWKERLLQNISIWKN